MVRKRGAKQQAKKQTYRDRSKQISKARHVRQVLTRVARYSFAISLVVLVGVGAWLETSGRVDTAIYYTKEGFFDGTSAAGFNLETIYYDGLNRVTEDDLLAQLPITNNGDGEKVALLRVSLDELKVRLEAMGWIERVEIERKLPDALYINVIEREPKAIWQYEGVLKLIDRQGVVVQEGGVEEFSGLPIIVGEDANAFFESLYVFMSEYPALLDQVSSIIRIGGRRWNVRLKNEVEIMLPEKAPDEAWRRLAKLQRESRILDRQIKSIDLRVEDRLFIQTITENE